MQAGARSTSCSSSSPGNPPCRVKGPGAAVFQHQFSKIHAPSPSVKSRQVFSATPRLLVGGSARGAEAQGNPGWVMDSPRPGRLLSASSFRPRWATCRITSARSRASCSPTPPVKGQRVQPAQFRVISADVADDAVDVYVDGQLCPLVARVRRGPQMAHVSAHAGNAQQAALFLQPGHYLIQRHPLSNQIGNDKRINVSGPVGVEDTRLQGKAEAVVHAFALQYGANGAAAPQMTGNHPFFPRQTGSHIGMRSAVIAHFINIVLLRPVPVDAVHPPLRGNGGVKGRFKGAHQRHMGHELLEHADGLQIGGIVGGSHRQRGAHALQHPFVNPVHAGIPRESTVLKPTASMEISPRSERNRRTPAIYVRHGLLFRGNGNAAALEAVNGVVTAHPLHPAHGQRDSLRKGIKLEFQRGTARIAHQYVHPHTSNFIL